MHSQALNYHVRPPETTLFEDSPKSKFSNQNDMSYPRNQERLNKLHQSEESGGILHTNEEGGEHESDDNPEGENDIEYIIMNLYSKMKNLENKYIDLANFYKQELVKSSSSKYLEGLPERTIYGQEMRSNAISPSRSFDRSPDQDLDQSVSNPTHCLNPGNYLQPGKRNMPQEREIIKDLIEEKKRLEEDMKHMISLKTSSYYQTQSMQHQQSPQRKQLDYHQQVQSPEQVLALKQQLQNALSGVLENIESTQKNQLQVLTQKQNEMHQLASKNNLPIQLRNDSISLWYDAKSKLSLQMTELKSQIQAKQMAASSGQGLGQGDNQQQILESFRESQIASTKFADDLEKELIKFRRKTEYLSINVQKFKSSLKYKGVDLRDDQAQIQSVLRDIYKNIQQLENRDFLLLSGEKQQNSQMLSPFEKRLVNYQKSAEMRKESSNPLNRSGSRGRQGGIPGMTNTGSNFYKGDFQNNQGIMGGANATTDSEQDSLMIKSKFKHLQRIIESYNSKANVMVQEQKEIDKIIDDTFSDQAKFLKTTEGLINSLNRENLKYNAYSKTKATPKSPANYLPISPKYNQNQKYDTSSNYSSLPKNNQQEQKLADLQKHNDQLFSQLRQANEKYLDERVQTNKLVGELKQLQKSYDDTQQHLRKLQQDPNVRQQIRKHSQNRNEPSSSGFKQSSYNSATTPKENEELRKRIQELEKECLTLTYYNQDAQRLGSINQDPYVRQLQQENQEGNKNFGQLCLSVQEFLMAMRRLQRAVNNKDKDIGMYKSDFERVKKVLERFIQETKEQQENKVSIGHQTFIQGRQNSSMVGYGGQSSNNQSMVIPQDKRDTRFASDTAVGGLRNKSQVPGQNKSNRALHPPMYPTQRQEPNSLEHYSQQTNNKRGVITAKQNNYMQSPLIHEQNVNKFEDQQSPSQEQKFNRLIEEIRETEEQSERQKHQIEELKSVNEILLAEQNASEVKSNQKTINLQKLNQTLKQVQDKVKQFETLLDDYKDGLAQLEQQQNVNKQNISQIKTELIMRERDLFNGVVSKNTQSQRSQKAIEQQSPVVNQNLINQLRDELTKQIRQKELEFEQVLGEINIKLQSKEQDLAKVKKLFVDKLRELESSFNEISQDMVDSEQLQQETTKRFHQQQMTKQTSKTSQKSELEKSIDNVIGRADDEQREQDFDKLIEANEELLEENSQLRQQIKQLEKDGVNQEELKALKEEVSILKEDNDELDQLVKQLREDEFNVQKQLDQLKIEHKRLQGSIAEITKSKEQTQQELQKQINEQEDEFQNSIKTLQQEQEQRVFFQSQFKNIEKQLKVMRNDKSALQNDNERLIKSEQELLNQIEQIKQEQEYMSNLRRDRNDDSFDDRGNEDEDSMFVDDQENEKIQGNPVEVAKSYYRMLKATKKEYLILTKAHDKIQEKHQELKNQMKEMKQEFRDDAENNINRETKLFDLENSNLRLTQELEKVTGDYVVEENSIREQIELQFRERLAFKDAEVESMTSKLARVSQTNSEMTTKILRLESNINELSTENESMKTKISSLEMELEMTKSNGDRDTEQLMEQQKQRDELQKAITQSDRAKEQSKITEQLRQIESQKQELENQLASKEEKLKAISKDQEQSKMSSKLMEGLRASLESKLQDMQKELEAEKQLREESEQLRHQQLQEQEEERLQLIEQQKIENKKLQESYKTQVHQEKIKQQDADKLREQFENDLQKKHEEEKALLEKRLREDREQQESRLLESEKEKIERTRKEMHEEKELQIQEKIAEEKQKANNDLEKLRLRLENEKMEELEQQDKEAALAIQAQEQQQKKLEEKIQITVQQMELEKQQNVQKLKQKESEQLQQLEIVQGELKANQDSSMKKIKELKLVQVLQKHARDAIIKELENIKEEQELKSIQAQQETQKLREDYEQKVAQLGELNEKQLTLVEQNLKAEAQELKKEKKQLKLVQVLQSKARESILIELEKEKHSKELQKSQDLQEIQRLKDIHEQEKLEVIKQNNLRIQELEQKLIEENNSAEFQMKQAKLVQALLIASRKSILNDYSMQQNAKEEQKIEDLERLDKLHSDHEHKLLQLNQNNLNKISLYEQKLQHDQEVAKKEKKSLLLVKVLQSKARQSILEELEQEKLARQNERQVINDRLKMQKEEHQKIINDLQNQNKAELQKLEQTEISKNEQLKSIKALKLIQALQLQARKLILKELEETKIQKDKQDDLAKQNYQSLNSLKEKEQQNHDQQVSKLHQQLKEVGEQNQEELDLVRDEHQDEIDHLNLELNKVRKEQEDLINSLSQQQDQQTQDLLTQKDNEARHLVAEMAHKHQLEIQEREKQNRVLQTANEKAKKELEEQIQELIQEKEEIVAQMEQDMQILNQDQEEQLEQVKLQDQEELERLRITYEEENLQNQKTLLEMEEQLEATKEHQRQMLQKFSESKQEEIEAFKLQIHDLQQLNEKLQKQSDDDQTSGNEQVKKLKDDHLKAINKLQSDHKAALEQLHQEKEQVIVELQQEQEQAQESLKHLNEQMLEQIKIKLQNEHQQELAKKGSEKAMFESLQAKMRDDLQNQIQITEKAKQEQVEKVQNLHKEIQKKELQQQAETISQQEHIDSLNQIINIANNSQEELKNEKLKLAATLESLKKQQSESENKVQQDLRAKVETLTVSNEKLKSEIKAKEDELVEVKNKLKQSIKDTENLEKDMDQFGKEMEDERAQNESNKEKINLELQELTNKINAKQDEVNALEQQREKQKIQTQQLESQLSQLKSEHDQEILLLNEQNAVLLAEAKNAKILAAESDKAKNNEIINDSIDYIQTKIGEFDVEIGKIKKLEKQLDSQKQLNDSLTNDALDDNDQEIIKQVGTNDQLQYIKRIKYMEKAWILIAQSQKYFWIDQDNIPVQKLQNLQFDSVEDLTVKLQDQLDQLELEKEKILKLVNDRSARKQYLGSQNENESLKQELSEIQLSNNTLQQNNLQLKHKINELNEMIFGLADTDKDHENMKKIVDLHKKSEELIKKLHSQIEETKKFEDECEEKQAEIDALRKQLKDQDYSFAQGGKSFGQGNKPDNFPLEASSIGRDPDEESFTHVNVVDVASEPVQQKVKRLEHEVEEYQRLQRELENSNRTLQVELKEVKASANSVLSGQHNNDAEMQDHLKHTRSILIKFLEKVTITSKENEDLLPIVYSMMLFTKEEMNGLMAVRQASADKMVKEQAKKGVFNMFGGNKKDKK